MRNPSAPQVLTCMGGCQALRLNLLHQLCICCITAVQLQL
jgi:hypothetical protein